MNRIVERFTRLNREHQKGFIVYIGAGDPNSRPRGNWRWPSISLAWMCWSWACRSATRWRMAWSTSLQPSAGWNPAPLRRSVLETVAAIRRESQIPIVLYIYFNLIHRHGVERFIREAAQAGVDGLLVLDLPPEESDGYEALMRQAGLCNIYLVAPTTPDDRIELIVKRGTGFIYYVSREGVTGMQTKVADTIAQMTAKIRAHTGLPIAVGFGISTPQQAKIVAASAEAVVVGSAIVNQIAQHGRATDLIKRVGEFVRPLLQAVKQP